MISKHRFKKFFEARANAYEDSIEMFEGGKTVKVEPEIKEEKIEEKKLTPEEEEKQKEAKRIRDENS